MTETSDLGEETGSLRPKMRPLILTGLANLVLAGVLLGIPYARGPSRAADVAPRFARFAACLFDGEALDPPGLGLPRGDRGRYASLVLGAEADWPGRCRDALVAIPPEETMFLFPGVKNAEAQLRVSVGLLDAELAAAQRRRDAGELTVSDRPMRALSGVRGALAELGVAAGVRSLRADRDAVRFDAEVADRPTPSIVPTRVAEDGALELLLMDGALLAGAADGRTVAHLAVADGRVEQRLSRRPGLLSALLGARVSPYAIFSTDRTQCADEPDRCAQRATGLSPFVEDRQILEPVVWLRSHPVGDPGEAIHVRGDVAWIAAVADEGIAVRRFSLPELTVRALGEEREIPQIAPDASWPVEAPADARVRWIDGDPPALAFVAEGAAGVRGAADGARTSDFDPPAGAQQIAGCRGWVAVGSERGVVAHHVESGATHSIAARLLPPDPGALRIDCRDGAADVWALADGGLARAGCTAQRCDAPESIVARDVAAFDVARIDDDTLVAWTDDAESGAIRVTRVGPDGATTTSVPAACWTDPEDGLCGAPVLASDGSTAALVARDGTDLRVVVTTDGERWSPLTGLGRPR